eukprot:UN08535
MLFSLPYPRTFTCPTNVCTSAGRGELKYTTTVSEFYKLMKLSEIFFICIIETFYPFFFQDARLGVFRNSF